MNSQQKHRLLKDLAIIVLSIIVGLVLHESGIVKDVLYKSVELEYVSIFLAGMFFTSVFTTAPAIIILGELALVTNIPILVAVAGLGALLGDVVIFKFFKDSVGEDLEALFQFKKSSRWKHLFKSRIFKIFLTVIGGIIIASPLPDELGLALMGFSKTNNWYFALISLLCNSAGILAIALIARAAL